MTSVEARAKESGGISVPAVYRMIAAAMDERAIPPGTVVDVGCGRGDLYPVLRERSSRYVGVDVIRHTGYPSELELELVDLETGRVPLADGFADVVVCAETIEHVENPRSLARELVRLVKPGGWLFVTTPNQLSMASILCLIARGQFLFFQEAPGSYPAHLSALLAVDLERIARECGLVDMEILYSASGRIPFTARGWPRLCSGRRGFRGRVFSDNVLLCGVRPSAAGGDGARNGGGAP